MTSRFAVAAVPGGGIVGRAELGPVPEPNLEGLEPAVVRQLETARLAISDQAKAADGAESDDLARAFSQLGRLYLLYEFQGAAAPSFKNAVKLVPNAWRDWYYLGYIHQQSGRFEQALTAFSQVLELNASDLPSRLRAADVHLRLRNLEQSQQLFAQAVATHPRSATAHYGLGRVYSAQREWLQAIASYERALELQPHADAVFHPLAMAKRQLRDMAAAKEALSRSGDSRPIMDDPLMAELVEASLLARTFLLQGDRARRRGLRGAAQRFYQRALELDPQDGGVRYNLGTLLGEMGRFEAAERQLVEAVRLQPSRADFHYNLAISRREQGSLEAASRSFAAAVALDENDLSARLELAATLHALGESTKARQELRLVQAAPEREIALSLRLVRYQVAMGEPAAALEELDKVWLVASKVEDQVEIQLLRAELEQRGGDAERAEAALRSAVALDERSASAHRALASFLARSQRFAAASEHFAVSARLEPDNAEPVMRGAVALVFAGRSSEARTMLEVGLERLPDDVSLALTLARLLATAPESSVRDPGAALELASGLGRAGGLEGSEALAMALAASGRFEEAVQLQAQLLAKARAGGAPGAILARLEANRGRYKAGQIARLPW